MTESNAAAIAATRETPEAHRRALLWQVVDDYSLIGIFVVLFAVLSMTVQYFFSWDNVVGLALSVSQIGMVACTMMFCLASRDFDLSVGSTVAFAGVFCAIVSNATGSVVIGIGASLIAGALVGFVNGAVIAKLKINALITTLATMEIVRGLAFIASHGQAVGVTSEAWPASSSSACCSTRRSTGVIPWPSAATPTPRASPAWRWTAYASPSSSSRAWSPRWPASSSPRA
jgi:L-arabinose transport system permease protein